MAGQSGQKRQPGRPASGIKPRRRSARGFTQASGLLTDRIRKAGAARGFAETRLLTQWEDIVGPTLAAIAIPEKVTYAKAGIGATLIIRANGAHGPELQMQLPQIRERVNACYGYNAISRVRITQTGAASVATPGMAEAQTPFQPSPKPAADPGKLRALDLDNVKDPGLRAALESLSEHVLSRTK